MSYTLLTPDDRQAMLQAVGAKSIEELLTQIPADIRLKRALNLPPALCEQELTAHISELANKNLSADNTVCFLGGGAYDHFIPSVVDAIAADIAQQFREDYRTDANGQRCCAICRDELESSPSRRF